MKQKKKDYRYMELHNFLEKGSNKKTKNNWKNHIKGGNLLSGRKLITTKEGVFGLGRNILDNALIAFGYNKLICKIDSDIIVDYCSNFRYFFRKFVYVKSKELFNDSLKESLNMIYLYRTKLIMYNYRGMRLIKGLPVRGQRTRTNKKTSKKKKNYVYRLNSIDKKKYDNKVHKKKK
jgi:hypothetical protein